MLSGHQRPHSNKCTEQSNHQISVKVKMLHLHIYLQNKAESRMEEMEGAVQTILVFFFYYYLSVTFTRLQLISPVFPLVHASNQAELQGWTEELLGWNRH